MAITEPSRIGTGRRILSVCLASALAVATLGASDVGDAASLAIPTFAARDGIVLAQTPRQPDKGTKPDKSDKSDKSEQPKKPKRRAVRCGGPGLPECPM